MVKNNDSMQQCSHGSATSENISPWNKKNSHQNPFCLIGNLRSVSRGWIWEPGHDLGGIAADVIFSTKHNPDTLNILPTFKVQIQGV